MKKNLSFLCLAIVSLLGISLGIGNLIAYLADGDTAINKLDIGQNEIELVEEFQPPKELTPGVSFTKDVSVINIGPCSCYVRIKSVFTDSDMEKYCTVDYNDEDFVYNDEDGFWYYKEVLNFDSSTPSLFTTVILSDTIPESEIKDFDILIYAESYQSDGFDSYEDAWEYYSRNSPS